VALSPRDEGRRG
jgi:hypothetical protein